MTPRPPTNERAWLPPGRTCAVCFTIDDVHPGTSRDAYEAGGDLDRGRLGLLRALHARQPDLRTTLFVTPDWREISPFPTRRLLARIPRLRDRFHLAPVLPAGTMALDRHPAFSEYLRTFPGVELALHGLHHIHPGPRLPVEFQDQSAETCLAMLHEGMALFARAGLPRPTGMQPPAWNAPRPLVLAAERAGLRYFAGARDVVTPVAADARTAMSGPRDLPLIHPSWFPASRLVHLATNFQATSVPERALRILDLGGVLAIKAHIVAQFGTWVALDALNETYCNYLDLLLDRIRAERGDSVWFASAGEIAQAWHEAQTPEAE